MKSKFALRAALMALLLAPGPALAEMVPDLYLGDSIVTGRENLPERARGLREALASVLVKLSGNPQLATDPRITPWQDQAGALALSWVYDDRLATKKLMDEQGTRDRSYHLLVQFDPVRIDAILAELGVKPWGADRPRVLVQLTITDLRGTYELASDSERGFGQRAALEVARKLFGLPLVLPASTGAPPSDITLHGDMRMTPTGTWNTAWSLPNAALAEVPDTTFDRAIRAGVGALARRLAGNE
jgi:hypothetical protein